MRQKTIFGIIGIVVISVLVVFVYSFSQKISPPKSHETAKIDKYTAAILSCYSQSPIGTKDMPIPNNSIQHVKETSRIFINMPKDLYPKDLQYSWTTVAGNATAGYVSNGGLPGEAEGATPECWSTYVDFGGNGEVDLRVKSTVDGVPNYVVRFIVSPV